jgi:glutamine cyclotransferase
VLPTSLSRRRRRCALSIAAAIAAAGALVAAGCGSGEEARGEGNSTSTATTPARPASGTVGLIRSTLREPGVQTLGYRVVRRRPHDPNDFTQGLAFKSGILFEGTGLYGESRVERRTYPGGRVTAQRSLPARDFGEGVEVLNGRVYQLTWREGRAHVYSARNLRRLKILRYEGEGWGLATNGRRLIMSDGTDVLRFRDPKTFRVLRSVSVRNRRERVIRLNELEYVGGAVLANVWKTDRIAIIDPTSGRLEGWIDLAGLNPDPERLSGEDVLNGIAFDGRTRRLLVTGKRWPTLFEIVPTSERED